MECPQYFKTNPFSEYNLRRQIQFRKAERISLFPILFLEIWRLWHWLALLHLLAFIP